MRPSTIILSLATLAIGASAHLNNDHKRMHTKMVKKANGVAAAIQHEHLNDTEEHVELGKRGSYSGRATYYATGVG